MKHSVLASRSQVVEALDGPSLASWEVVVEGPEVDSGIGYDTQGWRVLPLPEPEAVGQQVDGFGACFSELGWKVLGLLTEEKRQEVFQAFFSAEKGAGFSICRIPIGANDFAESWYSLNETPGDYAMEHFSVERDRRALIPFVRAALEVAPDLQLWASPWCPPSWMKVSGHYASRAVNNNWGQVLGHDSADLVAASRIKDDPQTLEAYALYFVRFVQAYAEEGIRITAVHPQNEVAASQIFPSCVWEPEVFVRFIRDHLHPAFVRAGLTTEIWAGTMNSADPTFAEVVLNHPDLRNIVRGAGFQWMAKEYLAELKRPEGLKLMQTESECHNGRNDWETAGATFDLVCRYFAAGVHSYMYWNFALDQWGLSSWGWRQNSLVTVERLSGALTYNPDFTVMRRFSQWVRPGARYLQTDQKFPLPHACFAHANGALSWHIRNDMEEAVVIRLDGHSHQLLPPQSILSARTVC